MLSLKLSKRYSKGLYLAAQEINQTEKVYNEMKSLYALILNSIEFKFFFNCPILEVKKKKEIIQKLFFNFSSITKKFIFLIIEKRRENHLEEIIKMFNQLYEKYNNIIQVYITTFCFLDELTINKIINSSKLVKHNSKIIINQVIDPSIIGGYILRVEDREIDSSVRSTLLNLKKKLM